MRSHHGRMRRTLRLAGCTAVASAVVAIGAMPGAASVSPVENPTASQQGVVLEGFDFDRLGYDLAEYVIDGTADSYHPAAPLTNGSPWVVEPDGDPQPFKTRIQVLTPENLQDFDGTVYVEWFNVSSRRDAPPVWIYSNVEMARQGAIYVGVSAQAIGTDDLRARDPERYGSLSHPGDSYSYDIFRQVAELLRNDPATFFGPSIEPEHLIAAGESQSAGRMTTYVNAFGASDGYDGYLIHSRGTSGAALRQAPLEPVQPPSPTLISDVGEPVLVFQAETDSRLARQPDSATLRWWEVAGTAHIDAYAGELVVVEDYGDNPTAARRYFDLMINVAPGQTSVGDCKYAFNAGPMVYVMQAAVRHLAAWVAGGAAPPVAPRLATSDGTGAGDLLVDEHGNAIGGVRTPHVDVPIATLRGTGNENASPPPPPFPPTVNFCALFGTTEPFSEEKLAGLYGNHGDFVKRWHRSLKDTVADGFVTREDARFVLVAAATSPIGQ